MGCIMGMMASRLAHNINKKTFPSKFYNNYIFEDFDFGITKQIELHECGFNFSWSVAIEAHARFQHSNVFHFLGIMEFFWVVS